MIKKLVNFRVDPTLWENYQNYCKSIGITATESIINHINSTLSDGKDCKDDCKDNNNNVKTECKDSKDDCKDSDKLDKEIEYIKNELLDKQIKVDNRINLLTQKIDKLEQTNDYLKQDNNKLNNGLKLIIDNQDKLFDKVEKLEKRKCAIRCTNRIKSSGNVTRSRSGEIYQKVDPSVETINYSSLTVVQLKNKLDQLGINYRKKAPKSELINLLSARL